MNCERNKQNRKVHDVVLNLSMWKCQLIANHPEWKYPKVWSRQIENWTHFSLVVCVFFLVIYKYRWVCMRVRVYTNGIECTHAIRFLYFILLLSLSLSRLCVCVCLSFQISPYFTPHVHEHTVCVCALNIPSYTMLEWIAFWLRIYCV